MPTTVLSLDEARNAARRIIAGFRTMYPKTAAHYTDGQIWQAAVDTDSAHPAAIGAHLLRHVLEGRTAPSAPQAENLG